MNPLRTVMVSISRIPPVYMLSAVIGLAAVTAVTVSSQMDNAARQAKQTTDAMQQQLNEKGKAVFAVKDIPEGQLITADAVEEREMQKGQVPLDALTASSLAAGRTAKYGITANAIVSQHDLASALVVQGFDAQLKEGQRAITFGVDNNSGVAGFIIPQSRIDILATVGGAGDTKVAPILSDVSVIAVGPTYQKVPGSSNSPASNITVAVEPEDAKKLVKAIVASKLYVTLRSDKDHSPVATVDVTSLFPKTASKELIANASIPLPPPPVPVVDLNRADMQADTSTMSIPKLNREIEMWSGGRKDLLTAPNN